MGAATDEDKRGARQPTKLVEDQTGEEVVMETLETDEGEAGRVKLSVSHMGLAKNLHSMGGGTRTEVCIQAQGQSRAPRKKNEKVLKDVTNKLEAPPAIAEASRPIMKVNGGQQNNDIKPLKKPGDV